MNQIILLFFLYLACDPIHGQSFSFYSLFGARTDAACNETANGLACNGCRELVGCRGGKIVFSASCKDDDEKTPYCKNGACSKENTCAGAESSDSKMSCPDYPGRFPDPSNCHGFFQCDGTAGDADWYSCSGNSKYDQEKRICSGLVTACRTFSSDVGGQCAGKVFQSVLATSDGSSYVTCPPKGQQPKLEACKYPYERFDAAAYSCSFVCPAEGFYPHEEKDKMYSCVRLAGNTVKYQANIIKCASGKEFDAKKNYCVKLENENGDSTDATTSEITTEPGVAVT